MSEFDEPHEKEETDTEGQSLKSHRDDEEADKDAEGQSFKSHREDQDDDTEGQSFRHG